MKFPAKALSELETNTGKGFISAYLLQSKGQVKSAIDLFYKDIGIPGVSIYGQSLNDLIIGHLKAAVRKDQVESNCPI